LHLHLLDFATSFKLAKALFLAFTTFSKVWLSCLRYAFAVSKREGMRSYRRFNCTSICPKALSRRFFLAPLSDYKWPPHKRARLPKLPKQQAQLHPF